MRSSLECIPCFIRQALDAARMITNDEKVLIDVMKKVLRAVSEFDLNLAPPETVQIVHRIIREHVENPDPYLKLKELSTKKALEISEWAEDIIKNSENPFETAVRFSIAGNIMDFGMKTCWDEKVIMASFKKSETQPVDSKKIQSLYHDINKAKTVLVIGDNAGETVFDRIMIKYFPGNADVYYGVKGSPVINDATIDDANQAGLADVAKIIPNGADISGTVLKKCSDEFISIFNSADIVISKGQGNFETLSATERKVYFLLQVKCDIIARYYNYTLGDWLVISSDGLNNKEAF